MLMVDQPAYLQPRIRHITSIRVHRLTVAFDEHALGLGRQDDPLGQGSEAGPHSSIEGYDLALPQKSIRNRVADVDATGTETGHRPPVHGAESSPEPVVQLIDQIVVDEDEVLRRSKTDGSPDTLDSLPVSTAVSSPLPRSDPCFHFAAIRLSGTSKSSISQE